MPLPYAQYSQFSFRASLFQTGWFVESLMTPRDTPANPCAAPHGGSDEAFPMDVMNPSKIV